MKTYYNLFFLICGVLFTGVVLAGQKTNICHHSKDSNSWSLISVSNNALDRHMLNHDDGLPGEATSKTGTELQEGCSIVACTGEVLLDACWFLSAVGASCDDACSDQGLVYDEATRTLAGDLGTADNCNAVMDALGVPNNGYFEPPSTSGVGCSVEDPYGRYRVTEETTSYESHEGISRACACMP